MKLHGQKSFTLNSLYYMLIFVHESSQNLNLTIYNSNIIVMFSVSEMNIWHNLSVGYEHSTARVHFTVKFSSENRIA